MQREKVKRDAFSLFGFLFFLFFIRKLFPFNFIFPAKKRAILVEWLNNTLPGLRLPLNASDEELRMCLIDGTILCRILNRLRIGSVSEVVENVFISLFYKAIWMLNS